MWTGWNMGLNTLSNSRHSDKVNKPTRAVKSWLALEYLSRRRLRCKQMAHSRRKSCWFSPHSDPGSGRVCRSCCSDPDIQPGPRESPLLSLPGPRWHHLAAETEYNPESLSAWMPCLLGRHKLQGENIEIHQVCSLLLSHVLCMHVFILYSVIKNVFHRFWKLSDRNWNSFFLT